METKRFIGSDLTRLYARVKRDLGPEAVIVRTRSLLREGAEPLIEIVAAPPDAGAGLSLDLQQSLIDGLLERLDEDRPATVGDLEDQIARESASRPAENGPFSFEEPATSPDWLSGFIPDAPAAPEPVFEDETADQGPRSRPAPVRESGRFAPLPDSSGEPAPSTEWAVRPRPSIVTRRRVEPASTALAPEIAGVPVVDLHARFQPAGPGIAEALIAAGLSDGAAGAVARSVHGMLEPAEAVARFLADRLSRYPDEGQTALITIEGPAGSGRTTALMRMALDCADAGRSALLLAADTTHVGAREQVHAYGEAIGLDVTDAFEPDDVLRALNRARRGACVFADVPAGDWRAPVQVRGSHYRYLALPGNWRQEAIERSIRLASAPAASGWVLTFADITTNLQPVLSLVIESPLGIAFLSSGRDVTTGVGPVDTFTLASGIFTTRKGDATDGRLVATA